MIPFCTISAYTRAKSGDVVIQAHDSDGNRVAERITKRSYPFLVVNLYHRPAGSGVVGMTRDGRIIEGQVYDPTLTVYKATSKTDAARREYERNRQGTVILRRHVDGTYSDASDNDAWVARQAAIVDAGKAAS